MLLDRSVPALARLAKRLAALAWLVAAGALPWLLAGGRSDAAAPAEPSAAELATVVGAWRELELQRLPVIDGIETAPDLRGTMNDWAAVAPMNGNGDGVYSTVIELARGEHPFQLVVPAAGLYRFSFDLRDARAARVSVSRNGPTP